jgi:hypothetical protein
MVLTVLGRFVTLRNMPTKRFFHQGFLPAGELPGERQGLLQAPGQVWGNFDGRSSAMATLCGCLGDPSTGLAVF